MPRLITLLVCSLFAIKALVLIDATGLWSDELYSVGKSFQPSLMGLMAMLRNDPPPPRYYICLLYTSPSPRAGLLGGMPCCA